MAEQDGEGGRVEVAANDVAHALVDVLLLGDGYFGAEHFEEVRLALILAGEIGGTKRTRDAVGVECQQLDIARAKGPQGVTIVDRDDTDDIGGGAGRGRRVE